MTPTPENPTPGRPEDFGDDVLMSEIRRLW